MTRIDGSPVQYVWLPTNTAYVPSAEAIEEVSIVTNSYTAEVGMAGGAAINVVVKSGTNAYRGTGWFYDTDADWRARNPFQTTPNNPKNIVKQYGANHGGRIISDRLFYFFNVERTTQEVGAGSRLLSIAPANLRPNAPGRRVPDTGAGWRDHLRPALERRIRRCARRSRTTRFPPTASIRRRCT